MAAGRTMALAMAASALLVTVGARAELPFVESKKLDCLDIRLWSTEPGLRVQLSDLESRVPVARCTGSCRTVLRPGRYRLDVAATRMTVSGSRSLELLSPSRLVITPRTRARQRTGLLLGVAGVLMAGVGGVLVWQGDGRRDNATLVGLSFAGSALLNSLGWYAFFASRPRVELERLEP